MYLSLVVHLLGIVLWLGGLLMLSRIMILHTRESAVVRPRFSFLERKVDLFSLIGLLLVLCSGLYQLLVLWPEGGFRAARWMHYKITLVLILFVVQVLLTRRRIAWQRGPADAALGKGLPLLAHSLIGLLLIGILCSVYFGHPHYLHGQ